MINKNTSKFAALLIGVSTFAMVQASAQDADTSASENDPVSAQDDMMLGAVLVTGQKREQRLQDVPVQVDAVSAKTIEALQIKQTSELARVVPNFAVERTDTYTNSVVVLRGIAQASRADSPLLSTAFRRMIPSS